MLMVIDYMEGFVAIPIILIILVVLFVYYRKSEGERLQKISGMKTSDFSFSPKEYAFYNKLDESALNNTTMCVPIDEVKESDNIELYYKLFTVGGKILQSQEIKISDTGDVI